VLSERDQKRVLRLNDLQREGRLGEFLSQLSFFARERGVGQHRDPLQTPELKGIMIAHQLAYSRPTPLTVDRIMYEVFPSTRAELADELLFKLLT
jgi:hypothetical protein